jgi:RNA recognition motif-containing protein
MVLPSNLVQIIHDRLTGASRGFGFVTIKEDGTIEMAITALNGKMKGRIHCKPGFSSTRIAARFTASKKSA